MNSETGRRWGIRAVLAGAVLAVVVGRAASAAVIIDPPGESDLGALGAGTTIVRATVGGDCEAFSSGGLLCSGELLDFRLDLLDGFALTSIQATFDEIVAGPAGMTVRFLSVPPDQPIDFEFELAEGETQTVFSGSFGGPATVGRFFSSVEDIPGAVDGTDWSFTASWTFEVVEVPTAVPEPGGAALLILGLSCFGFARAGRSRCGAGLRIGRPLAG